MKVIDKTPLQNEKGEISPFQRLQGTLEHGFAWYPELEAQKAIITQLDRVLEKGFTLIRNVTLGKSQITEPLVLVGTPGVYVIYVTTLSGFYEAKGDQWNQVRSGRSSPAGNNPMLRVARLARALQVYLNRQGVNLPGPVEAVLMASSPALHIDSLRPMVRVVLSDAVRQFGASLLQARPILRPELAYEVGERIVTPKPREAPVETPQPEEKDAGYYLPPALRDAEPEPEQAPAPSRARAIFHAAEESKPFDPSDLSFQYDENAESEVPENLKEPSPSQQLAGRRGRGLSGRQLALLGVMMLVELCVLAGFGYFIFFGNR